MPSKVYSAAVIGLSCERIEVECDAGTGQFSFVIVGLPDTAVQESRERVRAAMKNSGFSFPRGRVTVNLAPADIRKEGPSYDLPIALSILFAEKQKEENSSHTALEDFFKKALIVGELALDGSVRPVAGVLSMVLMASQQGVESLFVPAQNISEARFVKGVTLFPVRTLREVFLHVIGETHIEPFMGEHFLYEESLFSGESSFDMSLVQGQEHAKRALEIAAAGGHNILLSGPPGSGKTLLARTLPTILPPLTFDEAFDVTLIYSAVGLLSAALPFIRERPFRSPHHTASSVSLIGGGNPVRPGEVSLAHRGVLFLDEFPEFPRQVLESLRQPLEEGCITVSRSSGTVQFPARCMLVAAQNPCPCGNAGLQETPCVCSFPQVMRYQKRISGPLLDRIDIHVDVPRIPLTVSPQTGESSAVIRERVCRAREACQTRFEGTRILSNAEIPLQRIHAYCALDVETEHFLEDILKSMQLSARAYHRLLKVSRTIADLEKCETIETRHIAESLAYRPRRVY